MRKGSTGTAVDEPPTQRRGFTAGLLTPPGLYKPGTEVFNLAVAGKRGTETLFIGDSDTQASLIEERARNGQEKLRQISVDNFSR